MKQLTLVALFLVTLAATLTACTAVRLCGIGALNPRRECMLVFYGNPRSGAVTGSSGVLVPRGLYPSATPAPPPWRVEIYKRCGREALRQQQEYYAKHGVETPYAPLETKCKRREIARHRRGEVRR